MTHATSNRQETVRFMDIDVQVVDEERLFGRIMSFIREGKTRMVMYVNAHCMVISEKDEPYRKILNKAHLVYADGISLVWAGRFTRRYLPCRLTAADFMPRFFHRFSKEGIRVYLLGAAPGVADAAARRLKRASPELQIVGTHHGYFDESATEEIIGAINRTGPHVVMVGMGVPYQEKWIERYHCQIDASVIWGVGALFDFLSGRCARGPQWLLNSGFEWLCRLIAEPGRLGKRYIVGNSLFVWYVLRWRARIRR